MGKKAVKAKKEVAEVYDVGDIADYGECSACGVLWNPETSEKCPVCQREANPGPALIEPVEKAEVALADMVTCQTCGTIFDREIKGVDEGGLLAEAGLHCPNCSELVEDGDGQAVKGNPNGKDSNFGDEVDWG